MGLIEDARAAKEAGMNYGVWKSLQPVVPYKKKEPETKVCANCGDVFTGGRVRFCCSECRAEMRVKNRKGDKFV